MRNLLSGYHDDQAADYLSRSEKQRTKVSERKEVSNQKWMLVNTLPGERGKIKTFSDRARPR